MNNIVTFPNSNNEKKPSISTNDKKTTFSVKVLKFFWLIIATAFSPFIGIIFYVLNKVSTVSIVFSVMMMAMFYAKTGFSKPFFIGLAYFIVAVLIKMMCNKKGR